MYPVLYPFDMARPLRIQYPGACYHITCRGNEQRSIFHTPNDITAFMEKLNDSVDIFNVSLHAYVCMPNHFHLLLTTPEGNLSEFMRHFNISYTSAFNRAHHRVGNLYRGRYKSFLIDADNYLLEVSRYIHLNPVRTKEFGNKSPDEMKEALKSYAYSSLAGYVRSSNRERYVSYHLILDQMGGDNPEGRQNYWRFVLDGIDGDMESPLKRGKGHGIVGDEDFVNFVRARHLKTHASKREQPALRELGKLFEPQELVRRYLELTGKSAEEICRKGRHSLERSMLMELLYRFSHVTQPEIGSILGGIDYSAVSQSRKRFRSKLVTDPGIQTRFDELKEKLVDLSRSKF